MKPFIFQPTQGTFYFFDCYIKTTLTHFRRTTLDFSTLGWIFSKLSKRAVMSLLPVYSNLSVLLFPPKPSLCYVNSIRLIDHTDTTHLVLKFLKNDSFTPAFFNIVFWFLIFNFYFFS